MIDYDKDLSETESGPFFFTEEQTTPGHFAEGFASGVLVASALWGAVLIWVSI